jgi:hypothetical protein
VNRTLQRLRELAEQAHREGSVSISADEMAQICHNVNNVYQALAMANTIIRELRAQLGKQ